MRNLTGVPLLLAASGFIAACATAGATSKPAAPAAAPIVIGCSSSSYRYTECKTSFRQPQLVRQISKSPCIVNRSWGFNRQTGRIWVSAGCAGVFGEASGFHYGQANLYDSNAHYYDDRGAYTGTFGPEDGADVSINAAWTDHQATREKVEDHSQDADPTVQKFDQNGFPNYDYEGNYIGGHGIGTTVDNPDAPEEMGVNPQPENGTYTQTDGNTTTTTIIQTGPNAGRMEQTTTSSGIESEIGADPAPTPDQ